MVNFIFLKPLCQFDHDIESGTEGFRCLCTVVLSIHVHGQPGISLLVDEVFWILPWCFLIHLSSSITLVFALSYFKCILDANQSLKCWNWLYFSLCFTISFLLLASEYNFGIILIWAVIFRSMSFVFLRVLIWSLSNSVEYYILLSSCLI